MEVGETLITDDKRCTGEAGAAEAGSDLAAGEATRTLSRKEGEM